MTLADKLGFSRLVRGLSRTREGLAEKISRLVSLRPAIDEETFEELEEILIAADVGVATTGTILDGVRERARREPKTGLLQLVQEEIEHCFVGSPIGNAPAPEGSGQGSPYVIMIVGVNGVGKTTTIGKLARLHRERGRSVMIAAADTFRAAANEQLGIWASRAGAELVGQSQGADPAAVAFDAASAARARGMDVLIIDTAGRLHTKVNLMEELKKIRRVVEKVIPGAPHEVLLVIDASTGQNGILQARQFASAVGVNGLILTKLDGTAKGGIVLAIMRELNIPMRYVGVGEGLDDLQPFDRQAFIEALFAA